MYSHTLEAVKNQKIKLQEVLEKNDHTGSVTEWVRVHVGYGAAFAIIVVGFLLTLKIAVEITVII